jgi:hypothetical protein
VASIICQFTLHYHAVNEFVVFVRERFQILGVFGVLGSLSGNVVEFEVFKLLIFGLLRF